MPRARSSSKPAAGRDGLIEYRRKRNFSRTREPSGGRRRPSSKLIFVIQEHHATRLHFDFRLESQGVLKSWAITREPTLDPGVRRLAIETEDHPLDYARFAGTIPEGEYGAGTVSIWDHGFYEQSDPMKTMERGMEDGHIDVILHGKKLTGRFVLIRISGEGPKAQWLFFKAKPHAARLKIPSIGTSSPRQRKRSIRAG